MPGAGGSEQFALLVELVLKLAKELLHKVLARDQASGAAEFVKNDGKVALRFFESVPDLSAAQGFRHKGHGAEDGSQVAVGIGLVEEKEVTEMDKANDVVEVALMDGQTRIGRVGSQGEHLMQRLGDGGGDDARSGRGDLASLSPEAAKDVL